MCISISPATVVHPNPVILFEKQGDGKWMKITSCPISRPGYFVCIGMAPDLYSYWVPCTSKGGNAGYTDINESLRLGGPNSWRSGICRAKHGQVWLIPTEWMEESLKGMPLQANQVYPTIDTTFLTSTLLPACAPAIARLSK